MTDLEKRVGCWAILAMGLAWVVIDWANVGNHMGTRAPLWGLNWLRVVLLALATLVAVFIAVVPGRRKSLPLIAAATALMWAFCAYTNWRCYQLQTHQPGASDYWVVTATGLVMEIVAVLVTLTLWTRHRRIHRQHHGA